MFTYGGTLERCGVWNVTGLFNIRASDIEYNPFLLAYAIIEVSPNSGGNRIR